MKPVHQIKTKVGMTTDELCRELSGAGVMGAGRVGKAVDVLEKAIKDKGCTTFFGLAGCMVPGGMQQIIIDMINDGWLDAIVTTGAMVVHDIVEALGTKHEICEHFDDAKLHKEGKNRLFDSSLPQDAYLKLEDWLRPVLDKVPREEISICEFLKILGENIPGENSWLKAAVNKRIPVFSPGFFDSGLGVMTYFYHQEGPKNHLNISALKDIGEPIKMVQDSERSAAFLVGGGVPKNHIIQAAQFIDKGHTYGVQITTDRPEYGGLTGASLQEGISWGKFGEASEMVDVIADATIVLPIISAALKERLY
ncbi:MAG: deoxyhypusine synthase family protein [archaeon]